MDPIQELINETESELVRQKKIKSEKGFLIVVFLTKFRANKRLVVR